MHYRMSREHPLKSLFSAREQPSLRRSLRTEEAFNKSVVLRVSGEQGLLAGSHEFRAKDHLLTEFRGALKKNGAPSPILIEFALAKTWLMYSHRR